MSLAVIKLTRKATLWWDVAGYNLWSLAWGDFMSSFLARFSPLDPPQPSPPLSAPMYDLVMTIRYDTLN